MKRKYKTPKQLGLSIPHYIALIATRDMLKNGLPKGLAYSYACWQEKNDCGTTACIGGMIEFITGTRPRELWTGSVGIDDLFFRGFNKDGKGATERQAVKAINNVLETGKPKWDEVFRG